jgi:Arc/MetJ-type ribon-helix-helix transcriptional regulator
MKLSVSMHDDDLAFLDDYAKRHNIASRSGALRQAVRALRDVDLQDAYVGAWEEWRKSDDSRLWDEALADGFGEGGS